MSTGPSTSPQSWIQSYTPNKPIRKNKEQVYSGVSVQWFYMVAIWGFLSLVVLLPSVFVTFWVFRCFNLALFITWWMIFYNYFRTVDTATETMLTIRFMVANYLGHDKVCKFALSLEALLTYIPIVSILAHGLIRFTKNQYGVLIQYFPVSKSDEELEQHYIQIKAIMHRASGDMMEDWLVSSRVGGVSPLLKKIEKKMNNQKLSKTDYDLWASQYKKLKDGKMTPDIDYFLFVGLGECATPEDAMKKMEDEIPAILDGFENAHILAEQLTSESEIITRYAMFLVPRDIL